MAKFIFSEIEFVKLNSGSIKEYARLYTDRILIFDDNERKAPKVVKLSEVSQLIGRANEFIMSKIKGIKDVWFMEYSLKKECSIWTFEGGQTLSANYVSDNQTGKLRYSLSKDQKIFNEKGDEVAQFMCYSGSDIYVKMPGLVDLPVLKIEEPLYAGDLIILALESDDTVIFINKKNNIMEVYRGDTLIAAT